MKDLIDTLQSSKPGQFSTSFIGDVAKFLGDSDILLVRDALNDDLEAARKLFLEVTEGILKLQLNIFAPDMSQAGIYGEVYYTDTYRHPSPAVAIVMCLVYYREVPE